MLSKVWRLIELTNGWQPSTMILHLNQRDDFP